MDVCEETLYTSGPLIRESAITSRLLERLITAEPSGGHIEAPTRKQGPSYASFRTRLTRTILLTSDLSKPILAATLSLLLTLPEISN